MLFLSILLLASSIIRRPGFLLSLVSHFISASGDRRLISAHEQTLQGSRRPLLDHGQGPRLQVQVPRAPSAGAGQGGQCVKFRRGLPAAGRIRMVIKPIIAYSPSYPYPYPVRQNIIKHVTTILSFSSVAL